MKGIIVFLCLITTLAFGGAQLVWNANPASDGVGKYVVYHGTNISGPFTNYGETAGVELPLGPLRSGLNVFYVTAVSTNGLEGDPSNKVLAPVPNPAQGLRIVIVIP